MLLIRNLKQIVVMLEPDLPYAGFSTFWEFIMTKFMPTRFKFRLMFMLSLLLGSGWLGGVFASPHALKAAPALQAATPTALPPSITLQKTVYAGHNGSAGCSGSTETIAAANNAQLTYCFVIRNTGSSYLNTLTLTDPLVGINRSFTNNLGPNSTLTYAYQTYFDSAWLNSDGDNNDTRATNLATITANPSDSTGADLPAFANVSATDTAYVTSTSGTATPSPSPTSSTPAVQLQKTVYLGDNGSAGCASATESVTATTNTVVTYCFRVTNTGGTYLGDIVLNDALVGVNNRNLLPAPDKIGPGSTVLFAYSVPFNAAWATSDTDGNASRATNTANVSANPVDSTGADLAGQSNVSGQDTAFVDLGATTTPTVTNTATNTPTPAAAGLSLAKTVYAGQNGAAGCATATEYIVAAAGAQVTYCFKVVNTGGYYLTNLTVVDPLLNLNQTVLSSPSVLGPNGTLTFAVQTTFESAWLTADNDGIADYATNSATFSASPSNSNGSLLSGMSAVSAQDVAVITVNAGNVPTAAATATAQPTQTGTLQAATATSTAINIPSVTPGPSSTLGSPSVSLQKRVYLGHNGAGGCAGASETVNAVNGQALTYCFVVQNTGGTYLSNVQLVDALVGVNRALTTSGQALAPNSTVTYALQTYFDSAWAAADSDGNPLQATNTATVTGNPSLADGSDLAGFADVSATDSAAVTTNAVATATATPTSSASNFTFNKTVYLGHNGSAGCSGASESVTATNGQAITYCFRVVNTGGTALTNLVLNDSQLGLSNRALVSAPQVVGAGGGSYVFAWQTYFNSAWLTSDSDGSAGSATNTASVSAAPSDANGNLLTGQSVSPQSDSAIVYSNATATPTATATPNFAAISLQKLVYAGHNGSAGCATASESIVVAPNAQITFCFLLENTGGKYLTNVQLNDALFGFNQTLISAPSVLAPRQKYTFAIQTTFQSSWLTSDGDGNNLLATNLGAVTAAQSDSSGVLISGAQAVNVSDTASIGTSVTATPAATNTATLTNTAAATNTPVPGATNTPVPSATNTPVPGATNTVAPTATNTAAATNTPVPGATNTPVPGATNTPVPGATNTPVPSATNTPVPGATNTPVPGATNTPAPGATNTPVPGATNTPAPGATNTVAPTATNTAVPTNTPFVNITPTVAAGDWGVAKSIDRSLVTLGDSFTYTIAITNNTNAPLMNLLVSDTLDANLAYQFGSNPKGTISANGQLVTAQVSDVPAGGTVKLLLVAKVQSGEVGFDIPNRAQVQIVGSSDSVKTSNQVFVRVIPSQLPNTGTWSNMLPVLLVVSTLIIVIALFRAYKQFSLKRHS
jgi:uncharacterized repeat protein (TIGR01451 family)